MKRDEEEIQRNIESGVPHSPDDRDALAYSIVFRALAKEREDEMPADFSDSVVKILEKKAKREERKDMVWLGLGVILLTIVFAIAIAIAIMYMPQDLSSPLFTFINDYKGIFVIGLVLIIIFNKVETRLLLRKQNSSLP